jgi:hypothetical protein
MRVEQALKHGFIQLGIMQIAFQFMPTSANCDVGTERTITFLPNICPKAVAQSKLKDFQEGEMRLGKACRLRKGETWKRNERTKSKRLAFHFDFNNRITCYESKSGREKSGNSGHGRI